MRQTSRAVALLLAVESAQAVPTANTTGIVAGQQYYETIWMPSVTASQGATQTLALNSRTAGYQGNQQVFGATAITTNTGNNPASTAWILKDVTPYQTAKASTTQALSTTQAGSFCMTCIGFGSVWCSRTYSYLELTGQTYQLENTAAGGIYMLGQNVFANEAALISGSAKDSGSCCGSTADFTAFVGDQSAYITPAPTTLTPAAGDTDFKMIAGSCPAFISTPVWDGANAAASVWGTTIVDATTDVNLSSWWCSNGLYKKQLTFVAAAGNVAASGTVETNAQQTIGYGMNKRKELAQVGCPQKADQCGQTTTIVTALTMAGGNQEITLNSVGPTASDKCTWVATSTEAGPSFFMSEGAGLKGLTTSNWEIHAMEYTATNLGANFDAAVGTLQSSENANQNGLVTTGSALQSGNYIPRFNMPAEQFATLRTWYGEATALALIDPNSLLPASWLTPGQAPVDNSKTNSGYLATVESQQYGNVVNVPASTIATTAAAATATVGNTNFGLVNNIKFDLRVARFFPAQVAQTVWTAGSAQQALYVSSKSTYDAAKTMWDNYVALLEKNAKTDAFAALFSPPKAPTVPPMPNMPWKPNAYAGYVRATAQEQFNYQQSTLLGGYTTANAPTAQQFWANLSAAQTVGGWGSFTAQILRYRNLWGKSFGTIGYSGDTNKNAKSAVWNYKWTCGSTFLSAPVTTSPCDASYTQLAASGTTWTTTTTPSVANLTILVSVVSLWSTSDTLSSTTTAATEYAWSNSSLMITWVPGAWSSSLVSLSAIAAPVAATAAKGLSGVAGAQALAATSAAALAVAAALY